ncbi:MAG TPA: phosphoadenylyl-sulfate reductase [Gemmatimonadaceae bacterium]|nr:phosphoadenylyl-sulfate reductase [Gemmatimonadaceae bacterium]
MIDRAELAADVFGLDGARAEDVLAWAVARFPGKVALTLSFGGAGVVLAHMLAGLDRSVPVVFIDTGFLFPETLAFKDAVVERYGLRVVTIGPSTDVGPLYLTDPDACCEARKVAPMRGALPAYEAWVSAIRRDQSVTRAGVRAIEYHEAVGHTVVKIHPLAAWTRDDVWRYIRAHDVPYHPLLTQGYASIGCWPCTRPTAAAEDERGGRWSGTGKTECGLHTFTKRTGGNQ